MIHTTLNKKKNKLSVSGLCSIAGVSRSGYYSWIKNCSKRAERDFQDRLDFQYIKEAYEYKSWKKGVRQIRSRIKLQYGKNMNHKKITRLMHKFNLICPIRKPNPVKLMIKQQQSHKKIENILNRNFNQGTAKKNLLSDISYLDYGTNQRAYLSVIKDATTKKILSWQLSTNLKLDFVLDTVKQLLDNYKGELNENVLLHTDQGVHYTSLAYQQLLKENGIIQSMSRRGNCWDNAPQESFFAVLKTEMNLNTCTKYSQLAEQLGNYINYYNYEREQSGLNWMTPHQYEEYLENKFHKYLPVTYLPDIIYL